MFQIIWISTLEATFTSMIMLVLNNGLKLQSFTFNTVLLKLGETFMGSIISQTDQH